MKKLNEIPLDREVIEFRIAQLFKSGNNVYANILAYKTARTDMTLLDEHIGEMNWQNAYKRDSGGTLQCGIGIYDKEKSEWIWKWSNGIPSNTEEAKGEYSDAFKRAGFMWGVYRKLYAFPRIVVLLKQDEYSLSDTKPKTTSKLRPNDWIWEFDNDLKNITAMQNTIVRFQIPKSKLPTQKTIPKQQTAPIKKIPINKADFQRYINRISAGEDLEKKMKAYYMLTPDQESALMDIIDNPDLNLKS